MFYYTNKSQQIFKKSTFQRSSTGPWKIDRSTINMDILRTTLAYDFCAGESFAAETNLRASGYEMFFF
jgi:hypothetical protein